jgi:hypothetical protein
MQRLAVVALVLAACGTTDDQRPRNLDYITEAILAPSCGAATCHSSFKAADGFVFDTVEAARVTFQNDDELIVPKGEDARSAGLILSLTLEQIDPETGERNPRMPINAPLPDADIALIQDWLGFGAPGVCNGLAACLGDNAVPCMDVMTHSNPNTTEKGAYKLSALVECPGGCLDGVCQ